jgi:hypothetical protein
MKTKIEYEIQHDTELGANPYVWHWNGKLQRQIIDYTGGTLDDCRNWIRKKTK